MTIDLPALNWKELAMCHYILKRDINAQYIVYIIEEIMLQCSQCGEKVLQIAEGFYDDNAMVWIPQLCYVDLSGNLQEYI